MKVDVTVEVGFTSLQEQAVARPRSAASLLGLLEVASSVDVGAPLAMTESTIDDAIDSICWAAAIILRRTVGAAVIVSVSTMVVVVKMRSVVVCVVVVESLVVTVLRNCERCHEGQKSGLTLWA